MGAPTMMPDNLRLSFWKGVETRLSTNLVRLDRDCEADLKSLIDAGVQRLMTDGKDQDPAAKNAAREALDRLATALISEMSKAQQEQPRGGIFGDSGFRVVNAQILVRVRDWFCPCYPFC